MAGQNGVADFLCEVLKALQRAGALSPADNSKVVDFQQPEDMQKTLAELDLGKTSTETELLEFIEKAARLSVRTGHAMFFNQLYGGVDKIGLAGAIVTEALNTSAYTYEVAPVFSLSEKEVLKSALKLVGFEAGSGIFSPGGSISNMYGIVASRFHKFPKVKQTGLSGLPPMVLYTSQESHYSIQKGANWLGFGTDNVVKVKCDDQGRMIPSELEAAILKTLSEGKIPLMANATAGSTVLGAFDPLKEIAEICESHGVWLHVDACWGGSLLLSEKYRSRLAGIDRADSVSWNPHKMMSANLQCSLFLIKHGELLQLCNSAGATYLFQKDKMYDPAYDSGDSSIQCGRKVDAFKLWALWKARGSSGLGALVDNAMELAGHFLRLIKNREGFRLVLEDIQITNVCFWYIPKRLRGRDETEDWWNEVHKVAPAIKKRLVESGEMMLGYQPLEYRGLRNFFRFVVTCQPVRTAEHMNRVVELIERHGEEV